MKRTEGQFINNLLTNTTADLLDYYDRTLLSMINCRHCDSLMKGNKTNHLLAFITAD